MKTKDEGKVDPTELKKLLCTALKNIGDKCTKVITKCFSQEDVHQMRYNHVVQMEKVIYPSILRTVHVVDLVIKLS